MSRWLSVDTDDCCHLPSQRGHPKRSSSNIEGWRTEGYAASVDLLFATDRFIDWVRDGPEVTIFLIAEQLDCSEFCQRLFALKEMENITFACHGWSHRCWSAWPSDVEAFSAMLTASKKRIEAFAGPSFRPWFRAPGGYIADWMAAPLAGCGFTVDSSINPSRWVARKMVPSRHRVEVAMRESGIEERPWKVSWMGPACGPALSLFPFSIPARIEWKKGEGNFYWHLLDHGREGGDWRPPLADKA